MYSPGRPGLDTGYCVSQRLAPASSSMSLFLCSWLWLLNYWSKQGQGASGWGPHGARAVYAGFVRAAYM